MKLKKIALIIITILLLILFISSSTIASSTYTLNLVSDGEIQNLKNEQGYISKKIIEIDSENGEITIELKLSNLSSDDADSSSAVYDDTEIYLIVSENIVTDEEKFSEYINDIQILASKIFALNSNVKIGIVGITGTIRDISYDDDGNAIYGSDNDPYTNGSEDNAEIVAELTGDIDTLMSDLKNMNPEKKEYFTNLQAAIRLANKSYSDNTNKILISLYDDVPDIAIGVHDVVSYGGWLSEYSTIEEAVTAKHEKIASYTKNEILTLQTSNVSFILLRPDDTSYDEKWYSLSTGELLLEFDGSPYVQELYGTVENPTYGAMYTFDEETLDDIITENMYADVKEIIISSDITKNNIKIVDYFSDDIIEYFDFEYVGSPSVGTASTDIDEETNAIQWDIETLKADETATLTYKLTLKDMENEELLNTIISTNEKAVLTYKDTSSNDYTITLTNSPKVKLTKTEKSNEEENEGNNDNNNDSNINNESESKESNADTISSQESEDDEENGVSSANSADSTLASEIVDTGDNVVLYIVMISISLVVIAGASIKLKL